MIAWLHLGGFEVSHPDGSSGLQTELPRSRVLQIQRIGDTLQALKTLLIWSQRGVPADELVNSDLWWHGPSLLREEVSDLPESMIQMPVGNEDVEVERKKVNETLLFCPEIESPVPFDRWSSLAKAYRVLAWVLRFIKRARKKVHASKDLCPEELLAAKEIFVKTLQISHYHREICLLKEGQPIPKDSKLAKLNPFCDEDGLLRVRGRIQLSELSFESKHPLILPKCHGSLLLVRFAHMHNNHAGVQSMITFIREQYEVFGLRQMAKQVKKSCVSCQKVDARACNEVVAPLPKV